MKRKREKLPSAVTVASRDKPGSIDIRRLCYAYAADVITLDCEHFLVCLFDLYDVFCLSIRKNMAVCHFVHLKKMTIIKILHIVTFWKKIFLGYLQQVQTTTPYCVA